MTCGPETPILQEKIKAFVRLQAEASALDGKNGLGDAAADMAKASRKHQSSRKDFATARHPCHETLVEKSEGGPISDSSLSFPTTDLLIPLETNTPNASRASLCFQHC